MLRLARVAASTTPRSSPLQLSTRPKCGVIFLCVVGEQQMIIPVRCYSCGKVVGNLYEPYKALLAKDHTEAEALEALGLERYCCRRMILTHIDLADDMVPYTVPVIGTMQKLQGPTPSASPFATPAGAPAGRTNVFPANAPRA
jgi:DNA-directed RNA polymerase I, II, and III subunit RPABC5